jgi:hypothetical protein
MVACMGLEAQGWGKNSVFKTIKSVVENSISGKF